MAYALVQDVAASWERYRQVAAALTEPTPQGLILHVAGPTAEGVRVIGVWESERDCQLFQRESLLPAIAALGGPVRPQATVRELRAAQVVLGAATHANPPSNREKREKQ